MNQYLFWGLCFIGVLFVFLYVPGFKVIGEALLKLFIDAVRELGKHFGAFAVWLFKMLAHDHSQLISHAITRRDVLDPTQRIRRKQEGYED